VSIRGSKNIVPAGTGHLPKTPKKHTSFDKKHSAFAKKCAKLQKNAKNCKKPVFTPKKAHF